MSKEISVVPYDPQWPPLFEAEARVLQNALGDQLTAIHHVGSTAVPRLAAKPKIDIIAVVRDLESITALLEATGYRGRGEFNIPFRLFFSKRGPGSSFNLHVYEEGNPEIELNLLFRDYLRTHEEARDRYAALKGRLLKEESSHQKGAEGFSGYNLGKDAFIKEILTQTGFSGLCMRRCTHHDEWAQARHFRQKYFFDQVPMVDPYTWTFHHQDHVHLVLYRGASIIGYAHIQLWPHHRSALRIIVMDENVRGQGLGGQFLTICERWLGRQGYKVLQTQSSPQAYRFYQKQGYREMPFNDPDGYESDPHDTDMGKVL